MAHHTHREKSRGSSPLPNRSKFPNSTRWLLNYIIPIQANERARHIAALREDTDIAEAGFVQILASLSAPEAYLGPFAGCNAPLKMVRFCTDEYEALRAELPGIFDSAERAAQVRRMTDLAWREAISVPYLYPQIPYVYRGDIIANFALNGYGLLDWTNFTVAGG